MDTQRGNTSTKPQLASFQGESHDQTYIACRGSIHVNNHRHSPNPIPRIGDSCPISTYRSGDFCKPFASTVEKGVNIIQESGDKCPTGYYSSAGSYCKRMSGSDREAITREDGGKCPGRWYKSGGYFVKQHSWSATILASIPLFVSHHGNVTRLEILHMCAKI